MFWRLACPPTMPGACRRRLGRLILAAGAAAAFAVMSSARAQPASPPAEPVLRIEAGMHTAVSRRIDTDAQGRWAATASDDKTARVWEMASGRLVQVLRPPIGPGNEGKLYAAAIAPDASVVAAAGWTKLGSPGGGNAVYLFDRAGGRLLHLLTGLPDVINHLAFSPDGRWLAVMLGGRNGVRVWDWRSGSAPLADTAYADGSFGAGWSRDGRLAVSSDDGKLRIYRTESAAGGPRLQKLAEAAVPGGRKPFGVSFHPDGGRIAVGYYDSTRVDVLDAATLAPLHAPSTQGVGNGNLGSVAWSRDGRQLAAAGLWDVGGRYPVRLWPDGGRGQPRDVPTIDNTVMHLAALPAGGWALGGSGPAWGVLGADGRWKALGTPPTADLRGSRGDAFLLADRGTRVQFGYQPFGKPAHVFDLRRRSLQPGTLQGAGRPDVASLPVQNWINRGDATLGGQPIKLEAGETSRSLAVVPGSGSFVLGTEWRLRHIAANGTQRWEQPVPGVAWGVNIPADGTQAGKLVVAAYGDGTIRWHRLADGRELLAFFPHADRRRWVLWTPSGYYDASPGAEDLIGWHVNRGADRAADFFPASRFRARFYRPDVIDRVLDTLDEAKALEQADRAAHRSSEPSPSVAQVLPPVVELLSGAALSTGSAEVTLRVGARTQADAPVTAWRVRINGELAPDVRGPDRQAGAARELTVRIPPRDSEIRVFAENRHGVSTEAVVRVTWTGAPEAPAIVKPRLYVLAIGVGRYQHKAVVSLGALPAKDAQDFVEAVRRQHGRLYESVEVRVLADAQATRDNVVDALEWLQRQPRQFDVSMLFVSGHGAMDPAMGYLFLPVNADPDALKRTAVNWADFKSTIGAMAGKRVVFMDTCHSGNALGAAFKTPFTDITGVISDLAAAENGVVVFASSTGRQLSIQDDAWGNGAFTKALVEGIRGGAGANARGEITHKRLSVYVSDRVRDLTGGRQSPVNPDPVGVPDFAIAVK